VVIKLHETALGFKIYLNAQESKMMAARVDGNFERWMLDIIEKEVKDGAFFDVGSNKGYHSLFVASRFPKCPIYAFEPEAENCCWIRKSVLANGFENVEVVEKALNDSVGRFPFHLGYKSGWHSLVKNENSIDEVVEVECVTLDDFARDIETIDVMKLDTEGSELKIIQGGIETLKKTRVVFIEYDGKAERLEMASFFCKNGFKVDCGHKHHIVARRGIMML